jgi:hypothetical protein
MSRFLVAAPTQREFWTGERCFSVDPHNDDASPKASLAVARVERGVTTELHRPVGACKRDIVRNGEGILEVGDQAVIRRVRQRRSGSRTPATAISNSTASARRGSVRRAVSIWKPPDQHSLNALRPTYAASSAGQAIGEQRLDNGIAPNQKWSINIATRFAVSGAAAGGTCAPRQAPSSDRHRRRLNPTCYPRRPSHTEQR